MVKKESVVILSLMLTLAILGVALPFSHAGDPYSWFNKWILKESTWVKPPTTVSAPMGQNVVWEMKITVAPPSSWGGTITDAFVQDRFGAEIEIDSLGTPTHGDAWWNHGPGNGQKTSGKVFLTWEIGDLEPGQTATLRFTISTGLNGAGKQCYTSCGCYELNSGAVLKFMYNEKQYSVYSGPITVSVFDNQPVETEPPETESPETESPQVVVATVDVHPEALNLRSRGRWITCFIELPEGYDVDDIDTLTILLNETVPVESHPVAIGDHNDDGVPDLMIKFSRAEVTTLILDGIEERFTQITLTITGELNDGTPFEGSDTLKIIMPTPRYWRYEMLESL